jgi:hypothetical protein
VKQTRSRGTHSKSTPTEELPNPLLTLKKSNWSDRSYVLDYELSCSGYVLGWTKWVGFSGSGYAGQTV